MKKLLLALCLIANSASAAKLEDVKILSITPRKDSIELKLHAKSGPQGSYFFVNVIKTDPDSFDKLALLLKKSEQGDNFKLTLNIKSFSMSPSGSYYLSDSVNFTGTDQSN